MVGFSHPVLHIKYVATRKLHTYKCICTMFIPNPPIIECPKFVNDICWEWASKWANGLAWAPTRYQVLMTLVWDFAFSVMVGWAQGLKYPVDVQPWPEPYIKKRFMNVLIWMNPIETSPMPGSSFPLDLLNQYSNQGPSTSLMSPVPCN